MMIRRLYLGLVTLFVLGLVPAFAASPPAVPPYSQAVVVCDPAFSQRCIKPNADGSINTTAGGAGTQHVDGTGTAGTPAGGVLTVQGVANGTPQAVLTSPSTATPTDRAGTVTTGGTAQTAIAANAARKQWCIQNPPTATEVLQVRSGVAATTTTGVTVPIGAQACSPPGLIDVGIVSVLGATTGHAWQGTEFQ